MHEPSLIDRAMDITARHWTLWIVVLLGAAPSLLIAQGAAYLPAFFAPLAAITGVIGSAFISAALITLIAAIDDRAPLGLVHGLRAGVRRLLALIVVRVVCLFPIWGVLAITTGVGWTNFSMGTEISWFSVALAVGLHLVVGALIVMIDRVIVLEELSVWAGCTRGASILLNHLGGVLGVMLLLIGIAIMLAFLMAFIGTIALAFMSMYGLIAVILIALLLLLAGAAFEVMLSSIWTLAFREWQ